MLQFAAFLKSRFGGVVNIHRSFSYAMVLALLASLPAATQDRRTANSETERGRVSDAGPSRGMGSMAGRSIPVGSASRTTTSSRDAGTGVSTGTRTGGAGSSFNVPKLQGTSFNSMNSYLMWQDFLWNLQTRYFLDAMYLSRFYRNSEPLVTPHLMKMVVREPLSLSTRMLAAVDELGTLVSDLEGGKPVPKQDITTKAQEIRELAKKIRKDNTLSFVDQRADKEVPKGENTETLGLETIRQLRTMAVDMNTQLKAMYNQNSTATVSVQNLSQPSFESLSKGIERLTKVIENSAKHL